MSDDVERGYKALEFSKLKEHLENIPFWKYLGIKVRDMDVGYAELYLPFKEELAQNYANMHGGALATLLDVAGAVALITSVGSKVVNTAEMKINYLKPVTPEQTEVRAYGRVVQVGGTLGICTVELKNGEERLVAIGIGTYAIRSMDTIRSTDKLKSFG